MLKEYVQPFPVIPGEESADEETQSTPSSNTREYNNLWDWIRYGWEDLVNHPSSWSTLGGATSPGSTSTLSAAVDRAETLRQSTGVNGGFSGNYSVDQEVGENLNNVIDNNASISDAFSYGKIQGESAEDQLKWLIENDPENAQGWMEQLIGLRGARENTQQAMNYDKMMSDTRIQRTAKDLEAAGINPILAYQYLSGAGGSVGAASMPDSNVSTNAVSRLNNTATNKVAQGRAMIAIVTALLAIAGITLKAVL